MKGTRVKKTDGTVRRELGLSPECELCGHSNWTYLLRPGYWQCQRHGMEGHYDEKAHVIRKQRSK